MSLKEIYIESLKLHDWNYERHADANFDIGVKQKAKIKSIIAEAYEIGKDPAKIFYSICPEHLYNQSADYGIRTPWQEILLDQKIEKEQNQKKYNDVEH
tara:strand:+ start:494 stop:790 length:297 start_codon:yes stop_codon:yes gene_type:complete